MQQHLPSISLVAAIDRNRVMGVNNQLPWHLPADLQYFKHLTLGKPILMGRKTFESIGRPLPGRRNLIISRQAREYSGCEIFDTIASALQAVTDSPEVMVIGGADIFRQTLPEADRLYLTIIDHDFVGDTYFPQWSTNEWTLVTQESHAPDAKNKYPYQFTNWIRNKNMEASAQSLNNEKCRRGG